MAPGDPTVQDLEDTRSSRSPLYPASVTVDQESMFSGLYERKLLKGVGHCPRQESPLETLDGFFLFLAPNRSDSLVTRTVFIRESIVRGHENDRPPADGLSRMRSLQRPKAVLFP
jgi:hypothetical protein